MPNKPHHRDTGEPIEDVPENDAPEIEPPPSRSREELKRDEIATRGDFNEWEPDPKDTEAVQLTSPTGTKVTVSAEAAEELRQAGYR
jgi:hypothetical protein